uniref:ZP domain-containing protein n=1 Tax=Cynoglossus semilaevis TaxID=244447 RepID=A0A3P8WR90_CYNSE
SQVQSKCEDRSLVIQVESMEVPQFEAIDENGSQILKEPLAARCGYTIISNKMATSTTLRASFFSCYTHNQNDVKFTFRFNVRLRTSKGIWETQSISTLCFGPKWAHREVVCEEDYMEATVSDLDSTGLMLYVLFLIQVQSSTKATWQLMFLQGDGHKTFMSIQEAESLGYIVTSSAHRVVLRTDQRSPHAKVMMVHGVPVEVIQVSVVFRRLQMVVLLDLTMRVCWFSDSGEFNGAWLLWDVPWVMLPLVDESAVFESQYVGIRVDGEFLDQNNATSKGLRLVHSGDLVLIAVPFRAEGGYRKSWVVNNTYKEEFGISLLYEHDFSLTYDGSRRINIKHRLLRVLATPPLCHPPFKTLDNDVAFHILLGNIPSDVVLEEVWINKKQVMSGHNSNTIVLVFQYLGGGVVQYSAHLKFTLTIIPQRESYYHHTFVSSRVTNTFPPQIMAQCLHQGICFTIVQASPSLSLWEVGVDHEPLTFELVAQRGYKLHNDSHRMTLEVPIYSIGYRYDDINLFNFYGTFELLLRDSRTLQVQASTSKRCLFKTEDMTVCSSDGTITVITGTKSTRPTVQLKKLHLLDPDCRPKQLDESRALFEFRVNTCGTRPMVGESYVVYENEVIHDRQLITDGPNLISRDSQFNINLQTFSDCFLSG